MDQGTVFAQILDKSGPIITGKVVKLLRKAAADSDIDADVTSIPYNEPNESATSRIRNKGAKPKGATFGDLSHEPQGVGSGAEHRGQRHLEDSYLREGQLFEDGDLDSIEIAMGQRRNVPRALPSGGFREQSAEVLSSTLAGAEPQGGVRRQSVDREAERQEHEPSQYGGVPGDSRPNMGGLASLTLQNGVRGYTFWSYRHARNNFIPQRSMYSLIPQSVNRGAVSMEDATMAASRCERGLPIPENLLRVIVDGEER